MAKARSVFLPLGCLLLAGSFVGLSKHVPLEPFVPTVAPTASTFAFVCFKPSQVLATISVFSSFPSNCVGAGRFPTTRQPGGEANICTKAVPLYQADVFRRSSSSLENQPFAITMSASRQSYSYQDYRVLKLFHSIFCLFECGLSSDSY